MGNTKIAVADARVILRKGQGREFKAGGLWIYDNEIDKVEGKLKTETS